MLSASTTVRTPHKRERDHPRNQEREAEPPTKRIKVEDYSESVQEEVSGAIIDESIHQELAGETIIVAGTTKYAEEDIPIEEAKQKRNVLDSDCIKIKIGKAEAAKDFVVHSELFRDISKPLHELLNGQSARQTSKAELVSIEDTDPNSFRHIVKLAYKCATTSSGILESKTLCNSTETTQAWSLGLHCAFCTNPGILLVGQCQFCDVVNQDAYGFDVFMQERSAQHTVRKGSKKCCAQIVQ